MFVQELAKFRCDALNHWINGINVAIGGLDGVARDKIENQQAGPRIVISAIRQFFITLACH